MKPETIRSIWAQSVRGELQVAKNRWGVAREAYRAVKNRQVLDFAQIIAAAQGSHYPPDKTPKDTAYRLARAYELFIVLCSLDFNRARQYRRKYPYTRFDVVNAKFSEHEFSPDKLFDYLDYSGDRLALENFIDNNEHPAPEWERRAYGMYKSAVKLKDDFGVPSDLQSAAVVFAKAFDKWEGGANGRAKDKKPF